MRERVCVCESVSVRVRQKGMPREGGREQVHATLPPVPRTRVSCLPGACLLGGQGFIPWCV